MLRHPRRTLTALAATLTAVFVLSACAGLSQWGEDVNRALSGASATLTTYDQNGNKIDQVVGESLRVSRDATFDTKDIQGTSKEDSQVLRISIGDSHISHVGSSLIIAEEGIEDVLNAADHVSISNTEAGAPWLNDLIEKNRNLWKGKAKTVIIRSQSGEPIAVYAGSEVEAFATDVPKSTAFRIDGKYLFVYRCDYTVYDTDLLG